MLAILNFSSGINQPVIARTGVGSIDRSFQLPIELSGVTMTINGAACGLKSVSRHQIVFVVPTGLQGSNNGTEYPFVVNNNGVVFKGNVAIVPSRPDIFTTWPSPGPGGRARVSNVVNRVHTTEPFTVTTVQLRGGKRVPTVLRLRVTGVHNIEPGNIVLRIGSVSIAGVQVLSGGVLVEPGIYTIDFTLPPELNEAGDQPIVLRVFIAGGFVDSRLDDTAPRLFIL
jgi:uncharacterized protein (TIGR03437 family)